MSKNYLLTLSAACLLSFLVVCFLAGCSKKNPGNPVPVSPALAITSLSVNTGPFNTSVVITGTGFSSTSADDQVFFNGKAATIATATTTQLTATVPLGAGTGTVTLTTGGKTTTGPIFTYQLSAVVSTIAGNTTNQLINGIGTAASFTNPWGIVTDASNNLYVGDGFYIRKIAPGYQVTTFAGSGLPLFNDGKGAAASFSDALGMTIDASGNLYVADVNEIRKITPDATVSTLFSVKDTVDLINFTVLTSAIADASGNLYVTNFKYNKILRFSNTGVLSVFAGSGVKGSADAKGLNASFNQPVGITIDASGNLYVLDEGSGLIRKITPDATVTTIAGNGSPGRANGIGTMASFNYPTGIAIDASGNLYVADYNNYLIRKIAVDGTVSTIAGTGLPGNADGVGTSASFEGPTDLMVDSSGNIYVTDGYVVRKITME